MGQEKKNIIPETTLVATQVHVAESEARPEETHASFKAVLPNLRYGCALGETLRRRKRTPHRWARRNTIRAVFERDHRRPQDHLQKEATGSRPCIYWKRKQFVSTARRRACRRSISACSHCGSWYLQSFQSRRYARRSFSASVRIRIGHVLCSCKIFRTKIASAATRCFLKDSHSATLSPRASSKSIAFSGGGSVLVRHRCVEAALREHARQRLQSQAPVLHFSAAMPAGSCLFAMAVTVAGRKTTPPERGCLHTVVRALLC